MHTSAILRAHLDACNGRSARVPVRLQKMRGQLIHDGLQPNNNPVCSVQRSSNACSTTNEDPRHGPACSRCIWQAVHADMQQCIYPTKCGSTPSRCAPNQASPRSAGWSGPAAQTRQAPPASPLAHPLGPSPGSPASSQWAGTCASQPPAPGAAQELFCIATWCRACMHLIRLAKSQDVTVPAGLVWVMAASKVRLAPARCCRPPGQRPLWLRRCGWWPAWPPSLHCAAPVCAPRAARLQCARSDHAAARPSRAPSPSCAREKRAAPPCTHSTCLFR